MSNDKEKEMNLFETKMMKIEKDKKLKTAIEKWIKNT